jgi:hypothetical protein
MPFTKTTDSHTEEYWNNFFEILKNIMNSLNYSCDRSDTGPYSIIKNIILKLQKSELVVAVLTDLNVNVYYELGIRHTLKHGTIMLLEDLQSIPFDIGGYGIIKYVDNMTLESDLKNKITKYLQKMDSETIIDNPVLDTFGFRLSSLTDVNFRPLKFEWMVNDQEESKRIWVKKSIYQWEESCPNSPSLSNKLFACLGESTLYGIKGFEVQSLFVADNVGFRIFIPNKGEKDMRLFSAVTNKQPWKPLSYGEIKYL